MTNVHDVAYALLRRHGVITIFGNPGSKRVGVGLLMVAVSACFMAIEAVRKAKRSQ
jgi:hypothetical protein